MLLSLPSHSPFSSPTGVRSLQQRTFFAAHTSQTLAKAVSDLLATAKPGDYSLGKSPKATIQIALPTDQYMSSDHAVLSLTPEGLIFLKDQSRQGTWLNGKCLDSEKPVLLKPGDKIRFANQPEWAFELPEGFQRPNWADVLDYLLRHQIPGEYLMGRSHDVHLPIPALDTNRRVSGKHAILKIKPTASGIQVYLEDCSSNGTVIVRKGQKMMVMKNTDVLLMPNDDILFGVGEFGWTFKPPAETDKK